MEGECFKCGASEFNTKLYEVIHDEGVVKFCQKCALDDSLPLVRKPSESELREAERPRGTVYQRLSKMSGVSRSEDIKNFDDRERPLRAKPDTANFRSTRHEVSLRDIVDRNFESKLPQEKKVRADLVDNFNWKIMRARRLRKVTAEKLAKAIGESPMAIKSAEAGIVAENEYTLLIKLEKVLNIILIKDRSKIPSQATFGLDPVTKRTVTIGELKKMKDRKDEEQEAKNNIQEGLNDRGEADGSPFIDENEIVEKGEGFFSRLFGLGRSSNDDSINMEHEVEDNLDFDSDENIPLNLIEKDLKEVSENNMKDSMVRNRVSGNNNSKRDLSDEDIRRLAFGGK